MACLQILVKHSSICCLAPVSPGRHLEYVFELSIVWEIPRLQKKQFESQKNTQHYKCTTWMNGNPRFAVVFARLSSATEGVPSKPKLFFFKVEINLLWDCSNAACSKNIFWRESSFWWFTRSLTPIIPVWLEACKQMCYQHMLLMCNTCTRLNRSHSNTLRKSTQNRRSRFRFPFSITRFLVVINRAGCVIATIFWQRNSFHDNTRIMMNQTRTRKVDNPNE